MKLTFHGGVEGVTGSCHHVQTAATRFLVDCGMFQGGRDTDAKNHAPFAFEPRDIEFVLLTHAHIDHSGLLPRLVAEGFAGPIYATAATCDLLKVMLLDSAHIQEKEAEWRKEARSRPPNHAKPIYTVRDAERTLRQLKPVAYGHEFKPHEALRCIYRDAGHILGSAIIEAWIKDGSRTVKGVFSGDIGQPARALVRDATPVHEADFVLIESTYGNRLHRSIDETLKELEHAITDTLRRKRGNVIVPAFAVGRAQEMLYLLADLHRRGRLPKMQIYVDSPLAMQATEITLRHMAILDPETSQVLKWARNQNGIDVHFVQDVEDSIALHQIKRGAIIISASGMCDAGRIKHHLRHNLPRKECTVLITGFQAAGTLGRRLVDGAKDVRLFGIPVAVRADIYTIGGLSAHADQAGLLGWLKHFNRAPAHTFIVHGEPETAALFGEVVREQLRWPNVTVPQAHVSFDL
ncbi:MAG: MBL fold metallo-hydrolase [Betaproteobacteria bacterium]|nr:MBL fold metallo-hydrolase [Betaproteobacteria bacterium]